MATIRLGAFDLVSVFAKGGQGQIWGARHREQGTRAAIKVLTAEGQRSAQTLRALQDEVLAVARLDHPSIVQIFDAGTVSKAASVQSGGLLPVGSPYLAMEYASSGSLLTLPALLPWSELRDTLLVLLDALATAHASGLVHRDLKLGNVLISSRADARPGLKLTDFGIAAIALDERDDDEFEQPVGTLRYMAPEQIRGAWRDQGPWTDLFGLGSVAWRLATGRTPFAERSGQDLIQAQLFDPPPRLPPSTPVPEGFAEWLRTMLGKRPEDRFTSATHAAYALRLLPSCGDTRPKLIEGMVDLRGQAQTSDPWEGGPVPPPRTLRQPLRSPVPRTGRTSGSVAPSLELLGTGTSLFGVRRRPLVGREREFDAVWKVLRRVATSGLSELVVLQGHRGVGTSTLMQHLCEAAAARAGATVLSLTARAGEAPGAASARLVTRWLRLAGLDATAARQRVRGRLEEGPLAPSEHRLLADDVVKLVLGDDAEIQHVSERHTVIERLLRGVVDAGVRVIAVDDAPLDEDALQLVGHLMDAPDLPPMVVIASAQIEDLGPRPFATQLLDALIDVTRASRVELAPLSTPAMRRLVNEALGLHERLAVDICALANGLPNVAVQVVGELVNANRLVLGADGFELRAGDTISLPASLVEVWAGHVAAVVAGLGDHGEDALELFAVLGSPVALDAWRTAAGELSAAAVEAVEVVAARLIELGLAAHTNEGWTCKQAAFQQHLLDRSQARGRLSTLHRCAAHTLLHSRATRQTGDAERLGLHLLNAGEAEAAVRWLVVGTAEREALGGPHAALAIAERCVEALAASTSPAHDPRRGQARLVLARLLRRTAAVERANEAVEALWLDVITFGWATQRVDVLLERACCARLVGELDRARESLHELNIAVATLPDANQRGMVLMNMAAWYDGDNDLVNARRFYEAAAACFSATGDVRERAIAWRNLADIELRAGFIDSASALFRRAHSDVAPDRAHSARCLTGLGEVARHRGDSDAARRWFERALTAAEAVSRREAIAPHVGLAKLDLSVSSWSSAHAHLLRARRAANASDDADRIAQINILRLPALAVEQSWEEWHRVLSGMPAHLPADLDLLDNAERAAALALQLDLPERAVEALRLGLKLANARGDVFAVLRLQAAVVLHASGPDASNREEPAHAEPNPTVVWT